MVGFWLPTLETTPAALRFGQLGLDLVNERGLDAFKARVYLCFAVWIGPRLQSIGSSRELIRQAYNEANKVGDLAFNGFCHFNIIMNSLFSGVQLDEVDREAMAGADFSQKSNNRLIAAGIQIFHLLNPYSQGNPERPPSFEW